MSRYVINILASRDLNDIADYYAERNVAAGDRFFRDFIRTRSFSQLSGLQDWLRP
jgi:toxin ParE1/3/4